MAYISIDTNFDIRTLEVVMYGEKKALKELLERNTMRYRDSHIIEYGENLSELDAIVDTYRSKLASKVASAIKRLKSTENTEKATSLEASYIFINSVNAVKNELENFSLDTVLSDELCDLVADIFETEKNEALIHLSMFIEQYTASLSIEGDNYMKIYVYTMINHGYLFNEDGKRLSLLVFLSFYEAYVNRIVGLTLIRAVNEYRTKILELETIERVGVSEIIQYAKNVSVPNAKSCYFTEFQKWFKGNISEFIKRFLIFTVDEEHRIPYQKATLVDKKKLRSDACSDVPLPPISIPSPPVIGEFFLISDSHYRIM